MIIRNFPLFDTEVLYRNIAKRNGPLYFFQRPVGQWDDARRAVKTPDDTNLTMPGQLPHPVEFRARGFFVSIRGEPRDLAGALDAIEDAQLSICTGWLEKQGVVALKAVPVHPMSILQPCPDEHLQLWCVADPHVRLYEFPLEVKNAACITAQVEWPRVANDPGLESPVRLRLVVVGDLLASDGYWRV